MESAEKLGAWRAEITAEIEQLEGELSGALRERAAADLAHATVAAKWSELFLAVRQAPSVENGVAEVLFSRMVNERDEALRLTAGSRARARNLAASLEERIASRRLALRQIDEALRGERKSVGPVLLKAERPRPALVDFDTITESVA